MKNGKSLTAGGVVSIEYGSFRCEACTLANNEAPKAGVALVSGGSFSCNGCTIKDNKASQGDSDADGGAVWEEYERRVPWRLVPGIW